MKRFRTVPFLRVETDYPGVLEVKLDLKMRKAITKELSERYKRASKKEKGRRS